MLKIVRNDIVKMECDAIVNTANEWPIYADGVDRAVYEAAGAEELLAERNKIGYVKEGDVFMTDAYKLPAKKIIHAVSPLFTDGSSGEERLLRSCYRKSLKLASDNDFKSIAFPLISTGSFGYPMEDGMRIAVEEINGFFGKNPENDMIVYLVVFGNEAAELSKNYTDELESYIEQHYVDRKMLTEYGYDENVCISDIPNKYDIHNEHELLDESEITDESELSDEECETADEYEFSEKPSKRRKNTAPDFEPKIFASMSCQMAHQAETKPTEKQGKKTFSIWKTPENKKAETEKKTEAELKYEKLEKALSDRIAHMQDSFSDYLMYLIELKNMKPVDVYSRACVNKKVFSKIKNNSDYHPSKEVALRLCVGAKLNIDETRDLLARAGYALSPSSMLDVIFEFFIEQGYYNIIEIDIQIEEHGLKCMID